VGDGAPELRRRSAREVLEAGSASTSKNGRALYLLAEAQRRTHDMAAAEATARKLIALDARNLAGFRVRWRRFSKTNTSIRRSSVCSSRSSPPGFARRTPRRWATRRFAAYFDLVDAYEQLKQYDKALAVLTQGASLPEDPIVDVRMARTQLTAGKGAMPLPPAGCREEVSDEPSVKIELASA
jgi:tetratricopeptide (TPR) repeat protein